VTKKYVITDTCSIRKLCHLGDALYSKELAEDYELAITETIKKELLKLGQHHLLDKFPILSDDDSWNSTLDTYIDDMDKSIPYDKLPKKNDKTILSTAIGLGYSLVTNDATLKHLAEIAIEDIYEEEEDSIIEVFKAEEMVIHLFNNKRITEEMMKVFVDKCNKEGPYIATEYNSFFSKFEEKIK